MDAIILKRKVWYLNPAAICEAKHASPKWMKDDDDYLMPFKTKKKKQKEWKKFHQETVKRVASYILHMVTQWEDMDAIFVPYHIQ